MQKQGTESYDLISVFFLALSGFVCIISLLIMGDVIAVGPFEPDTPSPLPTQDSDATFTPTAELPTDTPGPATETIQPSPTWTDFPTKEPSFTPTATSTMTPTVTLTWTPSSTSPATDTPTPRPITETPTPTATETATVTPDIPTDTPGPTTSAFAFTVQAGTPSFREDYLREGCNWQGVAGQILLTGGTPGNGYVIRVTGSSITDSITAISGSNIQYGTSGWEIPLADAPINAQYTVQVFSPDNTRALSPPIDLNYPGTCQNALVLINFVQVGPLN